MNKLNKKNFIDVVFINPPIGSNYQSLKNKYTTIEPPTWSLLLAESMRNFGFNVKILDQNVENLNNADAYLRIKNFNPKLICFVVYGQNVNAGTANMDGAVELSNFLKSQNDNLVVSFIGSYPQALPKKTLIDEKSIDFVFTNEGVYALKNILNLKDFSKDNLRNIKGIAFRDGDIIKINQPEIVVPNDRMDIDLPGYAWDLLPYDKKTLDLYRAPLWHAQYDENKRSPYAAIQTSLGCQFKCSFCMINLINRNDDDDIGVSSNYSKMRYWSPEFIIKEFEKLIEMGVKTIKITDEMFLLNPKYYKPLIEKLSLLNKNDDLIIWAYSRIDTIKNSEVLSLVRKAGIKWLALGIESGDKKVRLEISKGKFEDIDVKKIVNQVHKSNIEIMANYMFGLPGDTEETIKKTFNLSLELCTSGFNLYPAMALPGSPLYKEAIKKILNFLKIIEAILFYLMKPYVYLQKN